MIRFRGTRLKLRVLLAKLTRRPRDVILRREFNLWAAPLRRAPYKR